MGVVSGITVVELVNLSVADFSARGGGARLLDKVQTKAPIGGLCRGGAALQGVGVHKQVKRFHKT